MKTGLSPPESEPPGRNVEDMDTEGMGIYVHWPFCVKICPYCDFNVHKNKASLETDLVGAIIDDLRYWADHVKGSKQIVPVRSIHFGGGTPSLLSSDHLAQIIGAVREYYHCSNDMEIGLEANPNAINKQALDDWTRAGIERLSIGAQSFDDRALKFLGRDHDGSSSQRAIQMAVETMEKNGGRVSCDLIFGLQWDDDCPQSIEDWNVDLQSALDLGVGHISAYQLTIEEATAFGRALGRGQDKAVNADQSADFYEHTIRVLTQAGFRHYEVSNFAKTGTTADNRSAHNLTYWRAQDYIGVGPGAHGRIKGGKGRLATVCTAKPRDYIDLVRTKKTGSDTQTPMSAQARAEEYILMGLRIDEGISLSRYENLRGQSLAADLIQSYVDVGLLSVLSDRLIATTDGRLVLDTICQNLLLGVSV